VARLKACPPESTVLEAVGSGQTRYEEVRADLGTRQEDLDHVLMQLARDGKVSLLVVGGSLCVRRED